MTKPAQRQATVLIVDDSKAMLNVLRDTVSAMGHRVITARDGAGALKVVREHDVDLVTCDIQMPQLSGIEVLRICRKLNPDLPVLMVTSTNRLETALEAVRLGSFDYIVKPFKSEELEASIRRGLESSMLRRKNNELIHDLKSRLDERDEQLEARRTEMHSLRKRMRKGFLESVGVSLNLIEQYSSEMAEHSRRVAEFAIHVGAKLGISEEALTDIHAAAMLHDVGLMNVPAEIVEAHDAGRKLTPEQREVYEQHPLLGMGILDGIPRFANIRMIVRGHHEHYDGTGYPDRISGETIPLGARILGVVEDYVTYADMETRPIGAHDLMAYLKEQSGQAYDPAAVEALLEVLGEYRANGGRFDDTGEMAEVSCSDLEPGMRLAFDARTAHGVLILARGSLLDNEKITKIQKLLPPEETVRIAS